MTRSSTRSFRLALLIAAAGIVPLLAACGDDSAAREGVPEDPATGSACASLARYLADRDARADGTLRWTVEQGFEMGRPSLIEIEADKGRGSVREVRVGGRSVMMGEGTLAVPE